jgi:hypothetical protein
VLQPEPGGNVLGDPVLAADHRGTFFYATLADDKSLRSIIGVARSTNGGKTWTWPVDASPGRAAVKDGKPVFQDKPWMTVDTTRSAHRGNVYVAWNEIVGNSTHQMLFSRSVDGGVSFRRPVVELTSFPSEGTCRPGIGTQVAVGPKGEVYVVWIAHPLRICFQKSLDGGITFTKAREIVQYNLVGHSQPNCQPKTDPSSVASFQMVLNGDIRVKEWPSLAVDTSKSPHRGTIYMALPSGDPPDEADVFLVYSRDGGETWSGVDQERKPIRKLNDDETTTDQFHPTVAVGPDGAVLVSWYDRRLSDPLLRPNWVIDIFAALSTDGGKTFGPSNFQVTDKSFPPSQTNPNSNGFSGCYMGEYNGMVAGDAGEFLLAWGDNREVSGGLPDPNVYVDTVTCVSGKPGRAKSPCRR